MITKLSISLIISISITSVYLMEVDKFILQNSNENIKHIMDMDENDHAELYSGQTEGDMVLTPQQIDLLYNEDKHRTGLVNLSKNWPNNEVPYKIAEGNFSWIQEHIIILATKKLMEETCIKFVPYNEAYHKNYVLVIGRPTGCYSYIGMNGGMQILNLAPAPIGKGCFKFFSIVHEFIHALGFVHMQCATERDEYIKIVDENISKKYSHNFKRYSKNLVTQYGIEYDYGSVMHYNAYAFSENGEPTMVPLKDLNGVEMGQRERLSDLDIKRINAKYCKGNNENGNVVDLKN